MGQKSVDLTIEMKELIVARSESVKNKAELSRLLDIPRMTIASALHNYKGTGSVGKSKESGRKKKFTNIGQNALLCLDKVSIIIIIIIFILTR